MMSSGPTSGRWPNRFSRPRNHNRLRFNRLRQPSAFGQSSPTDTEPANEPLRELTLGRSSPKRGEIPEGPFVVTAECARRTIFLISKSRCRQKSEAARWAAERLRRELELNDVPIDNAPDDPEMVTWGDCLVNSFYWSQSSDGVPTQPMSAWSTMWAGASRRWPRHWPLFEPCMERHPGNAKVLERSLPLLAEAQSALRAAVQRLGSTADPDQVEIFEWLKATAARHHVYIKRFMRADEVADPARWSDLLDRIESLAGAGKSSRLSDSQIVAAARCSSAVFEKAATTGGRWSIVVDEVVGTGIPPSNREIRDLLLPLIEELPARDDYPAGFRRVLRRDRPVSREPRYAIKVDAVARALAEKSKRLRDC